MNTEVAKPQSPHTSTGSRAPKDPLIDNAKVGLIVLVVLGHSWSPIIDESHTIRAFYLTLYAFHMPAFVLLSGYLSRSFRGRMDQWYRVLTTLIVPYVVFSILYGGMRYVLDGEFEAGLLNPYFQLWFLVALLLWRLTAPLWRLTRFPILIATVISFGASLMDIPQFLDLGRVLQFLPFFVAGMFLRHEHFMLLRRWPIRITLAIASLGILLLAFLIGGEVDRHWTYLNKGAEQLDLSIGHMLTIRVVLLAFAAILISTFLAWTPNRRGWITALGAVTMYPYLLHGFFVKTAEHYEFDETAFFGSTLGAITVTVAAIALAALLMTPPVRWITKPFVEPKLRWAIKRPPES